MSGMSCSEQWTPKVCGQAVILVAVFGVCAWEYAHGRTPPADVRYAAGVIFASLYAHTAYQLVRPPASPAGGQGS